MCKKAAALGSGLFEEGRMHENNFWTGLLQNGSFYAPGLQDGTGSRVVLHWRLAGLFTAMADP